MIQVRNWIIAAKMVNSATMPEIIRTIRRSVKGRWKHMNVTRLFRLSALSFSPSKVTRAFLRVKNTESKIMDELKM